jgi:hypothetical protein
VDSLRTPLGQKFRGNFALRVTLALFPDTFCRKPCSIRQIHRAFYRAVDMVVRPYFTQQKQVLPFDKIIELETIDDWTFRSIVKAYSPTGKLHL